MHVSIGCLSTKQKHCSDPFPFRMSLCPGSDPAAGPGQGVGIRGRGHRGSPLRWEGVHCRVSRTFLTAHTLCVKQAIGHACAVHAPCHPLEIRTRGRRTDAGQYTLLCHVLSVGKVVLCPWRRTDPILPSSSAPLP